MIQKLRQKVPKCQVSVTVRVLSSKAAGRHVDNAVSVYISGRIGGNREQMMKLTGGERSAKGQIRESRKNTVESDRQK